MAYVEQVTKIANPARRRRKRSNVARRMTLKQKLHFGSKRQRASAKSALSRKRHAKRRNAAPRKVSRRRTQVASHRPRTRKRNMGEIVYALGANPAKRRKGNMARTKTRHRAGSHKNRATRRHNRRRNPVMVTRRHHRRRNPGSVDVMGYVKLGASVVGGAVGSKVLTQLVMSSANTGIVGYFGNLVATIALGWGAHMAFRDKMIAQGVVGGGLAQIIVRALTDNTPYGSMLSGSGVGDYQTNWNFVWPQRVNPGYPPRTIQAPGGGAPAAVPVVTHSAMGTKSGKGVGSYWN